MSRPTHTVIITKQGEFKVVSVNDVPFKTKGTSSVKATRIKEALCTVIH